MPLPAPTSRRFLALVTLAAMSAPAAGQAPDDRLQKQPPLYCKLLSELPEHERNAYLSLFQSEAQGRRATDAEIVADLAMNPIVDSIPYGKIDAIERAFKDDHPAWSEEQRALIDALVLERQRHADPYTASTYQQRARDLWKHGLKARGQMRRDCEPKIG